MEHYYDGVQGWFNSPGFFREMVSRCRPDGSIVEVGCWKGRSLSCLLVEVVNSGKPIKVFGVDHWKGSVDEPKLLEQAANADLHAECLANCERSQYPHWGLITGDSVSVAGGIFPPLDFVFIDASHDRQSVTADIRAWLPHIRPGGIIGGHDAFICGVRESYESIFGEAEFLEGCWFKTIDNGLHFA